MTMPNHGPTSLILTAALAMSILLTLACGATAERSAPRGTLYLVEQDWDGQLVTTAVAHILLEQEMGHTVATRFAPSDTEDLFIGLEGGQFHFACCNWPSYSALHLEQYVAGENPSVERMGPIGIKGKTGWYVPSYVVNGDAQRDIVPVAPNLRTVNDLNQYKTVFATGDTGGKGRLLEITEEWDTRSAERLKAFGVDFQPVFAGSESEALARIHAAFQQGEPVLTYLWEPHWAHAKYNLVPVKMPEWTPDCYPEGSSFNCGHPTDEVAKLAWPALKDEFPDAYEFLSRFQITNEQQNRMVLNLTENDLTPRQAAQQWIDANQPIWRPWIP